MNSVNRRKRNQVACDLSTAEFVEFSQWSNKLHTSNGALMKLLIRHFLTAPPEFQRQILTHEIDALFSDLTTTSDQSE